MELFQLRSFLQVTVEGSITQAAARLYLTQPAVTQHVRALERELGVVLFERTGHGMLPTPAGQVLNDYARRIMSLLDEGRQVIAELEAGESGRLVLGAGVTTSIFHLPGWLRAFREAHPGIEVVVRTGRSREIAALVLGREIDLGFITSPTQHSDLHVAELYEEEILLVTPGSHPLAGRRVPAAALAEAPLILFPRGTGFRDYLDRTLASRDIPVSIKMESDSVEAIKSLVASGLGISFLPEASVATEMKSGELSRAWLEDLPPLRRKTAVVYRRDRYLSAGARGFFSLVCARYGVKGG